MSTIFKMSLEESEYHNPIIVVKDATPEHVRELGKNLRERDIAMANRVGIPAHRALWRVYKKSLVRKTVFVDGEIVAMWGVTGTFLGKVGMPWFTASPFVEGYPMKLVFRYRSELRNMLKIFPILEDWVCAEDKKTIKLLHILGFKFDEPQSVKGTLFMRAKLER